MGGAFGEAGRRSGLCPDGIRQASPQPEPVQPNCIGHYWDRYANLPAQLTCDDPPRQSRGRAAVVQPPTSNTILESNLGFSTLKPVPAPAKAWLST